MSHSHVTKPGNGLLATTMKEVRGLWRLLPFVGVGGGMLAFALGIDVPTRAHSAPRLRRKRGARNSSDCATVSASTDTIVFASFAGCVAALAWLRVHRERLTRKRDRRFMTLLNAAGNGNCTVLDALLTQLLGREGTFKLSGGARAAARRAAATAELNRTTSNGWSALVRVQMLRSELAHPP